MEVRLRRAATPRARPERENDATPRPCTRARATRPRPLHRQPLARPAQQHCTLQSAPRTASHTIHALTHPPPAFGRRHPACRRDSTRFTLVHPVAQVKQRLARAAAAQQAQQAGDSVLLQSKQCMTRRGMRQQKSRHSQPKAFRSGPAPFAPGSTRRDAHGRSGAARVSADHNGAGTL